jgi:hypothetical protein
VEEITYALPTLQEKFEVYLYSLISRVSPLKNVVRKAMFILT